VTARPLAVLLGLAALAAAAPAGAEAARKPDARIAVPRPAAGTLALAAVTVTVKARRGAASPRLRLRFPKAAQLPPSVRILWAKRRVRRGRRTTFHLLFLSINVATPPTARAAQVDLHDFVVIYLTRGGLRPEYRPTYDLAAPDYSMMSGPQQSALEAVVERNWQTADGESAFAATPANPTLDTGHYDDGHAFGWNPQGQTAAWTSLTEFGNKQLDQVIAEIEASLAVDIDGDGDKGANGGTVDTTVGPPVISGGNP
jgi:hypothetical protein